MLTLLHRLSRWDALRLLAQATLAAVATYLACLALGLSEVSWAVISALFTVQASVGSTLAKAASRVSGGLLGLGIAVLCIYTIGLGTPQTLVSLAVAVAAMSLLSSWRPELNYGLVTVAILILAPGGDAVESALAKAAAIALGSSFGALAGLVILPLPAHRSAAEHLGNAVRRCRDLLDGSVQTLTGGDPVDLRPIHADIRREMSTADTMASQSQYRRLHRHPDRPAPDALLTAVQQLWHTLVLLDRVDDRTLADGPRELLRPSLEKAAAVTGEYLVALGQAMAAGTPPPPVEDVRARIGDVTAALDEVRRRGATHTLSDEAAERVFALSFALRQIYGNIAGIADMLGRGAGSEPAR